MRIISRDGAVAARVAHNHEVVGSSPAPATKKKVRPCVGLFFLVSGLDTNRLRRFALANMQVVGSGAKKLPAEACFDANFCAGIVRLQPSARISAYPGSLFTLI